MEVFSEVLWTIYPPEVVMRSESPGESSQRMEVSRDNRVFVVSQSSDGQRQIERLISSDPSDYLNPEWQPGQILH